MKKSTIALFFGTILLTAVFSSCSKEKDKPTNGEVTIKYEVTGNYSGQMTVIYTTETGSDATEVVSSLPWSKEVKVKKKTAGGNGVTFAGARMSGQTLGLAGQSVTAKIIADGDEKDKKAVTSTNGSIDIPPLVYTF